MCCSQAFSSPDLWPRSPLRSAPHSSSCDDLHVAVRCGVPLEPPHLFQTAAPCPHGTACRGRSSRRCRCVRCARQPPRPSPPDTRRWMSPLGLECLQAEKGGGASSLLPSLSSRGSASHAYGPPARPRREARGRCAIFDPARCPAARARAARAQLGAPRARARCTSRERRVLLDKTVHGRPRRAARRGRPADGGVASAHSSGARAARRATGARSPDCALLDKRRGALNVNFVQLHRPAARRSRARDAMGRALARPRCALAISPHLHTPSAQNGRGPTWAQRRLTCTNGEVTRGGCDPGLQPYWGATPAPWLPSHSHLQPGGGAAPAPWLS